MKILILSCDTGQGHNSAAHAVEEALKRRNIACAVVDPLTFGSKKTAGAVSATYSGMMKKTPALFGALYKAGGLYSATGLTSPVYYANAHYAQKLKEYIVAEAFTSVVCTHLFAMEAMTAIRKRLALHIPCYGVLTDYTCIPFFAETVLDGYLIPHDDLRAEMKHIPPELIHATGIPVSHRFTEHLPAQEARVRLGLAPERPMILIMSGGVGCGNIVELCKMLLKKCGNDYQVCVLVGRNQKLRQQVEKHFKDASCIRTVPFTDQVNLYMNAANVMISKPGGLTSTEAAVANVPLIHLLAYAGCETKNVAFFSARGISVHASNAKQAAIAAKNIISAPSWAERMRAQQREYIYPDAAERVADLVV